MVPQHGQEAIGEAARTVIVASLVTLTRVFDKVCKVWKNGH